MKETSVLEEEEEKGTETELTEEEEEQNGSLSEYEDELDGLLRHRTVIDNYFNQGRLKSGHRSDHARRKKRRQGEEDNGDDNRCNTVECDLRLLSDWFEKCDDHLPRAVVRECTNAERLFPRWLTYLAAGFNLIIFGLGSKRKLVQSFCEKQLQDYTYIVVDGFQPTVNSHIIFQCLEKNLSLKVVIMSKNQLEYANAVGRAIDNRNEDVVLVLHNIDGPGLRTTLEQWALAEFAKAKHTHIIATVDHVNKSLLWTQKLLNAFNFLFINVNTMQAYKAEVFAGYSKLLGLNPKGSGYTHTFASLDVVWMSLTNNSRSLLQLITNHYYRKKKAVEFFELFRLARNDFLVSTDAVLRQHLNEYNDHHLIVRKRHSDGNEYISMAVEERICIRMNGGKE
ncbi:origin recognition complex subunit 2 family protein, variant [Loa loa]|uniref:Origin recognition complex subunit 2 n=1 Tax=Loa loa TaxID=7209 RepID=A0A1S0UF72_LOALO|nr:origin recognition complex subunit 2 family protein, variant [Loa loa]EJD74066.1 origin recognition complex subunit 2 family protein, variant [Loa loa]